MYGTVMRGMPNHDRIAGAQYLGDARTAPHYRLLTVGGQYPLMVRDDADGAAISVQLFLLTAEIWRGKVDCEPSGLVEGELELDDGRTVVVMLGDPAWLADRRDVSDITAHGGWARFVASIDGG